MPVVYQNGIANMVIGLGDLLPSISKEELLIHYPGGSKEVDALRISFHQGEEGEVGRKVETDKVWTDSPELLNIHFLNFEGLCVFKNWIDGIHDLIKRELDKHEKASAEDNRGEVCEERCEDNPSDLSEQGHGVSGGDPQD